MTTLKVKRCDWLEAIGHAAAAGVLRGPTVAVALALSLRLDEETGTTFSGITYLARRSGTSRDTVIRGVTALEDAGLVTVARAVPGAGVKRRSNTYELTIPAILAHRATSRTERLVARSDESHAATSRRQRPATSRPQRPDPQVLDPPGVATSARVTHEGDADPVDNARAALDAGVAAKVAGAGRWPPQQDQLEGMPPPPAAPANAAPKGPRRSRSERSAEALAELWDRQANGGS